MQGHRFRLRFLFLADTDKSNFGQTVSMSKPLIFNDKEYR
jgi:hypothetical protein